MWCFEVTVLNLGRAIQKFLIKTFKPGKQQGITAIGSLHYGPKARGAPHCYI